MLSAKERYNEIISYIEENIENYTEYSDAFALAKATVDHFKMYVSNPREMNTIMQFLTERLLTPYIKERKMIAAYCRIMEDALKERGRDLPRVPIRTIECCLNITGYSDQAGFDKAFRKMFDMSPTEAIKKKDMSLISGPLTWDSISGIIERGEIEK